MGEQGGPYLTSGLKHSFRNGKKGDEEKSLSEFRVSSKPPFTVKGLVWLGTRIFSGPIKRG